MKKAILSLILLGSLASNNAYSFSDEFINYHMKVAIESVDEDVFKLIKENVKNLEDVNVTTYAANELINLIDEGYSIDPYNMASLIEKLTWYSTVSANAARVILKAIENDSILNQDHKLVLIKHLAHVNARNNATEILLRSIQLNIKFTIKERALLAELSRDVNAKASVERIREALHEKASGK